MKIRGAWRFKKFLVQSKTRCAERLKKSLMQLNRRGIILMYHRVADLKQDPWWISVSPARFEEHMRVLKKYGRPVQMREIGRNIKHFSFGQKEIVVTFDDGYSDNFHNAKPILEQQEIPATFFVVSGAVNSREEYWWDELGRITIAADNLPELFEMTIAGTIYHWRINSKTQPQTMQHEPGTYQNNAELSKAQLNYALWEIIRPLSFKEKKDVLSRIASWAGQTSAPRTDYLPITSQELISLAASPLFEIGVHTVSHPMLSSLPREKQEEEISRSKHDLENMLSRPITSFSYPFGDYSQETVKLVERSEFKSACTTEEQPVTRNTNPYLLPRFAVDNWNGEQFEKNLCRWMLYE